jgi:hypothetical protein
MLQFSSIGSVALVALGMCWSLAIVVFRVSPAGSVGRQLSLLLVVEGATLISTGYIDLFLTEAARAAAWYPIFYRAEEIVHTAGDCLMLALYPPFLSAALRTRLTAPFGTTRARIVLLVLAAVLAVIVLWWSLKIGGTFLYISLVLLFLFALLASIDAWRSADGIARSRAGTFAVAFGVRDVCWGFVYGWATLVLWQGTYAIVDPGAPTMPFLVYALGTLVAVPLIAYGILKTQLFDIDLKIQWTIRQSTVAAAFVAVFYTVTEGADRLFEAELGSWVGLLASASLIFVLAPLQRLAERVAAAVMPNTSDTPEYAAYRKMQVYEAALADAVPGGVSEKERALLNHLRDSLGISASDAAALERDLAEAEK